MVSYFRSSAITRMLILIMFTIGILFALFDQTSQQWTAQMLANLAASDNSQWFISVSLITILALDIILPIPLSVVAVFSASTLGFLHGAIVVWSGLMLGCVLGYMIGLGSHKFFRPLRTNAEKSPLTLDPARYIRASTLVRV